MRYDPKDANSSLLNEEICDFKVLESHDKISKTTGKEMIELLLKGRDSRRVEGNVKAYLATAAQVKQFCLATNQLDKFDGGLFTAKDCNDKIGKFMNKHDIDASGTYADKNSVRYWVSAKAKDANTPANANQSMQNLSGKTDSGFVSKQEQMKNASAVTSSDGAFDDDIPF